MVLSMVGIGLGGIDDITVRGLKLAMSADEVYLEHYTSTFWGSVKNIEKRLKKKVQMAYREHLEQKSHLMVNRAKEAHVCLLVVGDVFSATTHMALYLEAKKAGVPVNVVFNASVVTAVGLVGLELYKYGKITSVPFSSKGLFTTYYKVIHENRKMGLHTLCLLDLEVGQHENRYMTIHEAIRLLFDTELREKKGLIKPDTLAVGVARIGQKDFIIKSGTLKELMTVDFGAPMHALIFPGKLHFIEEEALRLWR